MCHANSNRSLRLYPVIDGGVLEPCIFWKHHEVWGSISLPCLSFSVLLLYQGSLGGCSVRPFKAHETSREWGDANPGQLCSGSLLQKSLRLPFGNICRAAIGWLQNLWLQNIAFQPQVSSFFWLHFVHIANIGRCFTNNEPHKPNLLCPEVTLQSKHTYRSPCPWNPGCSFSLLLFVSFNSKMILF